MCDILSLAFFLKLLTIVAAASRQYQAGQLLRKQAGFRKVEERGDSLASEEIISNHTVHSQLECSLKCLQSQACVGYNYRTKPKTKFAINCQLSNKTHEKNTNGERNLKWTFYQELELQTMCLETMTKIPDIDIRLTQNQYHSDYIVTASILTDGRTDTGGWGSATGATADYIKEDYGRPVYVTSVNVAGGNIPLWGLLSSGYGKIDLQYSVDDNIWIKVKSFPTPIEKRIITYALPHAVTAQYWRLKAAEANWVGTTEFALRPLTKPKCKQEFVFP